MPLPQWEVMSSDQAAGYPADQHPPCVCNSSGLSFLKSHRRNSLPLTPASSPEGGSISCLCSWDQCIRKSQNNCQENMRPGALGCRTTTRGYLLLVLQDTVLVFQHHLTKYHRLGVLASNTFSHSSESRNSSGQQVHVF